MANYKQFNNSSYKIVNKNPIILIILLGVFFSLISIFKIEILGFSQDWQVEIAISTILFIGMLSIFIWNSFKSFYLIILAYTVPLLLFHLGITIPSAFELFDDLSWGKSNPKSRWLAESGWYTILSISMLFTGWGISLINYKSVNKIVDTNKIKKKLYFDGIGLLIASLVSLLIMIYTFGNLLSYKRVDFYHGAGDTRGLGLFMMTLPSAVLCLVMGAITKKQKILASAVGFVGFFIFIITGFRSAALFPFILGVMIWRGCGNRIPMIVSGTALALVLIIIPASGYLRATGTFGDIDSKKINEAVENVTIAENFRVTGQTGALLAKVLEVVPKEYRYRYGESYWVALYRSLPNFGFQQSENYRLKAKKQLNSKEAISDLAPSDWLTYVIDPNKYVVGEGVGFSAIAEPYLNFGLIGVVIFFLALGMFFGRLDKYYLTTQPALLTFACVFMWPLIRTVRNDFGNFIKPLVFMSIILIAWRVFSKYFLIRQEYQ